MAKILITGANGHLGRRLIDTLAQEHEIQAVVRSAKAEQLIARTVTRTSGLNVSIINPSDANELADLAADCRIAVHLIGMIKETAENTYAAAHEHAANALIETSTQTAIDRVIYISILGADLDSPCECLRHRAMVENALIEAPCAASIIRVPMVLGEKDRN